jgi:hypothetical protein
MTAMVHDLSIQRDDDFEAISRVERRFEEDGRDSIYGEMPDTLRVSSDFQIPIANEPALSRATLGAIYFMTNRPINRIVISSISREASLIFSHELPTGGAGAPNNTHAEPLISQNSIIQVDGVPPPLQSTNRRYYSQ